MPRASGSLQELYRAHWEELCGYLRRQFGAGPPDPQDVAQAAFLKYAGIGDSAVVVNPRAFLFRTARNIAIDEKRRGRTRLQQTQAVRATLRGWIGVEPEPERWMLQQERLSVLGGVLERMNPRRRAMLLLSRVEGLAFTEIARRAGVSEAAVRKQINLALRDYMRALERSAL